MPVTATASVKETWIEIVCPARYAPFGVDEVTEVTFGAEVKKFTCTEVGAAVFGLPAMSITTELGTETTTKP